MSLSKTTKFANRYGLNLKFYAYNAAGTIGDTPLLTVDFANEVSLEASGDNVWATGGQAHGKMIGFKNLPEGTFKISTQVDNVLLKKLAAGENIANAGDNDFSVTFGAGGSVNPTYYIIKGDTVWQGEDGTVYTETVTVYKACVKQNFSATWNGDGDPQSKDIEFELALNGNNDMFKIEYADQSGSNPGGGEEEGEEGASH